MRNRIIPDKFLGIQQHIDFSRRMAVYPGAKTGDLSELVYVAMGLTGEAGEVGQVIKKAYRRGGLKEGDNENIHEELGDLFWYWCRMVDAMGFDPEQIIEDNRAKLEGRARDGRLKDR